MDEFLLSLEDRSLSSLQKRPILRPRFRGLKIGHFYKLLSLPPSLSLISLFFRFLPPLPGRSIAGWSGGSLEDPSCTVVKSRKDRIVGYWRVVGKVIM